MSDTHRQSLPSIASVFQPIISLAHQAPTGYEALLRAAHDGRPCSPDAAFELARRLDREGEFDRARVTQRYPNRLGVTRDSGGPALGACIRLRSFAFFAERHWQHGRLCEGRRTPFAWWWAVAPTAAIVACGQRATRRKTFFNAALACKTARPICTGRAVLPQREAAPCYWVAGPLSAGTAPDAGTARDVAAGALAGVAGADELPGSV